MAKSVLPVNMAAKMPVAAAPTDQPKNGTIQKTAVQQSDNIKQVQPTIGFQFAGRFIYITCIFLEFEQGRKETPNFSNLNGVFFKEILRGLFF